MANRYKPTPLTRAAYPLTGGVDTKIHGFSLPAPKLQSCLNAYVEQTGSIRRRFGQSFLSNSVQNTGSVAGHAALTTYKGNLVSLAQDGNLGGTGGKAYEYSSSLSKWVDKGTAESIRVRGDGIIRGEGSTYQADEATANGITVVATMQLSGAVAITVVDANGTVLKQPYTIDTGGAEVRVRARGNLVYVFYAKSGTGIRVAILDCSSATSLGTMQPTPSTVVATAAALTYDVAPNSTYGIFLAWLNYSTSLITFGFVDTSGVLGSTSTQAGAAGVNVGAGIGVAVAAGNALHGIAYYLNQTGPAGDVWALHRTFNGTTWAATATSAGLNGTFTATYAASGDYSIACVYTGLTTLRIAYSMDLSSSVGGPSVVQATYTSAGSASTFVATTRWARLSSRMIVAADGLAYFWVTNSDQGSARYTSFLIRQDDVVVAKALDGNALAGSNIALGQIQLLSDGTYSRSTTVLTGQVTAGTTAPFSGRRVSVDFGNFGGVHPEQYATVEDGEELLMTGGFLQQYDGDSFVEQSFLLPYTDNVANPTAGAGGSLTLLAIYSYIFVPESKSRRGTRTIGTYLSPLVAPALTGANNKHTFVLPTIPFTRKRSSGNRPNCVIGVYRTLANPTADSPHYRVGEVTNDVNADTTSFVDTMSDAVAATQETFYQDSGEVENTSPPAGHLMVGGNGRVFLAGFAEYPNRIMASKEHVDGMETSFSDFLPNIEIPSTGGPITGLAVLNGYVIAFKEDQIYRSGGEGPNNNGVGSFTPPELISSDTGTLSPRSIVSTPMGVFFQGKKGLMLLDQSFQVAYIGAPLEKLTDPGDCMGALLVPTMQHVRFVYESGVTRIWDYFHKQWYVWTHGSDAIACVWNDVQAGTDNDAVVYDDTSRYDDAGQSYAVTLKLGWAKAPDSQHGDLRVRKIGLTGESLATHYLTIYIRHDYSTTISQTISETIGLGAPAILRRDHRLSRQVGAAVEITIRDAVLDVYGADVVMDTAGFRLSELVFEIGTRSEMIGR